MKYKLLILVLLLAGALSYGWYLYSKPTEKTISASADLSVDARNLFAEYQENEELANQKYLNKVLRVSGRIASIEKNDSLGWNITLDAGDELAGVNCQIPEPKSDITLNAGDSVTMKGLCTGMLMDVVVAKCSLEKN